MKIRLERDVLAEAVDWTARSLPVRPSVPILAGLLVRADAARVTFSSFDYETSAQITVTATVTDEGRAGLGPIAGRDLPLPAGQAGRHHRRRDQDGTGLRQRPLHPADPSGGRLPRHCPPMPESTGSVPSRQFARAVSQVVVAAGRDELLPVFTGVRVEIDGDVLSLLATDRYRMALKELPWSPGSAPISAPPWYRPGARTRPLDDRRRGGHPEPGPWRRRRRLHRLRRSWPGRGATDHHPTAGRGVPQGPAPDEHGRADDRAGEHRRGASRRPSGSPSSPSATPPCGC